jgi:hypothetical protein
MVPSNVIGDGHVAIEAEPYDYRAIARIPFHRRRLVPRASRRPPGQAPPRARRTGRDAYLRMTSPNRGSRERVFAQSGVIASGRTVQIAANKISWKCLRIASKSTLDVGPFGTLGLQLRVDRWRTVDTRPGPIGGDDSFTRRF